MADLINYILAILPFASLIVFSLLVGLKWAALISLLITVPLFFYWGNPLNYFWATVLSSATTTVEIGFLVFGAIFLFSCLKTVGTITRINHSLKNFHAGSDLRFFLLVISLTTFFEGVAGFGTPGILVPPILVALGYNAILSVSSVILMDAIAVAFGALGTPIALGLKSTLGLTAADAAAISFITGVLVALVGIIFLLFMLKLFEKLQNRIEHRVKIFTLYFFFALPFIILTALAPELASVISPIVMIALYYLFMHPRGSLELKSWLPYGMLAGLLIIFKIPLVKDFLSWGIVLPNLFSTPLMISFRPLLSPLFPFLIMSFWVLKGKLNKEAVVVASEKLASAAAVLFPIILITQLLRFSDAVQPSLLSYVVKIFTLIGAPAYIASVPFLGILGAFSSGTNTVSNIMFGGIHIATAQIFSLPQNIILSLQTSGGALGNAISLYNIVAASAVVHIKDYHTILKRNITPTLLAGGTIAVLGTLLTFGFLAYN